MPNKTIEKDENDQTPPFLGSWRRIYWWVAAFFVAEVALFYVFTRVYS